MLHTVQIVKLIRTYWSILSIVWRQQNCIEMEIHSISLSSLGLSLHTQTHTYTHTATRNDFNRVSKTRINGSIITYLLQHEYVNSVLSKMAIFEFLIVYVVLFFPCCCSIHSFTATGKRQHNRSQNKLSIAHPTSFWPGLSLATSEQKFSSNRILFRHFSGEHGTTHHLQMFQFRLKWEFEFLVGPVVVHTVFSLLKAQNRQPSNVLNGIEEKNTPTHCMQCF